MNIALALIVDRDRRFTLIGRRPEGAHLGGLWEFAGGKVEPGESLQDCAAREASEETGLDVRVVHAWPSQAFAYPERTVTLHPFLCEAAYGAAPLRRWRWVAIESLQEYPMPEGNASIVARLTAWSHDGG